MLTSADKKVIRDHVIADKIMFKKDGTVEFRDNYFYRHGRSEAKMAEELRKELTGMGFKFEAVEVRDRWAAWPRESYFLVRAKIEKEG